MPSFALPFVACVAFSSAVCAQQATLIPLSFTPNCISRDGKVVAGESGLYPVYWTQAAGVQQLHGPSGENLKGKVWAASADGSVLAGYIAATDGSQLAFVWSAVDGMTILQGTARAELYGVSDDGNTIGVRADSGALIWKRGVGLIPLPAYPQATTQNVYGISGDGNVAVGEVVVNGLSISARWILDESRVETLTKPDNSPVAAGFALRANRDGSVIIGNASGHAYYWTTNGYLDMGLGTAFGINSDGRFAVLREQLYSAGLGQVDFRSYIATTYGNNVSAWLPIACTDISGDGQAVVGSSANNTGWLMRLPARPIADFDGDNSQDVNDFMSFIDCFEGTSLLPQSAADMDGDGFVDIFDFELFVQEFES